MKLYKYRLALVKYDSRDYGDFIFKPVFSVQVYDRDWKFGIERFSEEILYSCFSEDTVEKTSDHELSESEQKSLRFDMTQMLLRSVEKRKQELIIMQDKKINALNEIKFKNAKLELVVKK